LLIFTARFFYGRSPKDFSQPFPVSGSFFFFDFQRPSVAGFSESFCCCPCECSFPVFLSYQTWSCSSLGLPPPFLPSVDIWLPPHKSRAILDAEVVAGPRFPFLFFAFVRSLGPILVFGGFGRVPLFLLFHFLTFFITPLRLFSFPFSVLRPGKVCAFLSGPVELRWPCFCFFVESGFGHRFFLRGFFFPAVLESLSLIFVFSSEPLSVEHLTCFSFFVFFHFGFCRLLFLLLEFAPFAPPSVRPVALVPFSTIPVVWSGRGCKNSRARPLPFPT